MNRRVFVVIVAALALPTSVIGGALLFPKWRAQFPVRAYDEVKLGMTLPEITTVIGHPPGHYQTDHLRDEPQGCYLADFTRDGPWGRTINDAGLADGEQPPSATLECWNFDQYWIWVTFDAEGRAIRTCLLESYDDLALLRLSRLSRFERLRRWLEL